MRLIKWVSFFTWMGLEYSPRGLANQKECTEALTLIFHQPTMRFCTIILIIPFSHRALLHTHNPPFHIRFPTIMVFQTPDIASSPKINPNKADSQQYFSNTPINLLIVNEYEWNSILPPKKLPSSIKHPKHSYLYLQTTFLTPSPPQTPPNALTCRRPEYHP